MMPKGNVRMNRSMSLAALALVLAAPLSAASAPQAPASDGLIPRDALFGNPVATAGQISPDGRYVSWAAPVDGVLNLWVAPTADPTAAKPVTKDTGRGITQYFWAPDSRHLLFAQDVGGNENFHIFAVAATGGATHDLTQAGGKVRATIQGISRLRPDVVLIGLNDRDPRFFDLYEVDYRTGAKKLVAQNPGYGAWVVDNRLAPRFATRSVPGGGTAYLRREADGTWKQAFVTPSEDEFTTRPQGFDRDGATLYWIDSRGRDKAALTAMDVATLKTRVIAASDKAEIGAVLMDPQSFQPVAYGVNYLTNEWTGLTPEMSAHLAFLKSKLPGEITIAAITDDGSKAVVAANAAESPAVGYLYDLKTRTLTKLYESRPALARYGLRAMTPLELKSGDGKTLVSYLTLPAAADPDGDGRADRPVPMVLFVHGGPWARDVYSYNSTHQWLANRGYAVLSVNYRGSTGFGKGFVNAATHEFSGKMHQDLIDAVDWAVSSGVTKRDQVAIMGGSYGGYATLVGVTFTPDRFKCGVDLVGPSSLATLIESFPAYWRPLLEGNWFKQVGDPAKPEDRARMLQWSPITRVDAIRAPLLIGQGQNDPRVTKAESDRIVAAMKAKKLPVTYVNYTDEGHGFVRPPNRLSFNAITEAFLSKCLGGRYQPIGGDLNGAAIEVLEGAANVPGLPEALAARPAAPPSAATGR